MFKKGSSSRIVMIIIFLVVVLTCFVIYRLNSFKNDKEMSCYERLSKVVLSTRPTEVFIRGAEVDFSGYILPRSIAHISSETLKNDKKYTVIVINDLDDHVTLSDDEISLTKQLITQNNTMLIYLGKKYSTTWDDQSQGQVEVEGNLCYVYYSWDNVPSGVIGAFCESDLEDLEKYPDYLGKVLMLEIEEYLR